MRLPDFSEICQRVPRMLDHICEDGNIEGCVWKSHSLHAAVQYAVLAQILIRDRNRTLRILDPVTSKPRDAASSRRLPKPEPTSNSLRSRRLSAVTLRAFDRVERDRRCIAFEPMRFFLRTGRRIVRREKSRFGINGAEFRVLRFWINGEHVSP